jgi:hypothetical protein
VVFSLLAVALPAGAHSVAISTGVSCPSSTPNAGFTDIGGFTAEIQLAINCLAAFDITQGTTATTYSPNNTVLRWQMALFLIRQAADHGITIPAATSQGFTDIAGLPQATQDAINQIAALGISKGTTTTTFSPNDVVTRWQMALFLRRLAASAGVTVADDPAHNQFGDIGALSAEIQAAINFLADGHIALGTGGSNFSPNDPVFRWAMALFLTRVLAADGIAQPSSLVSVTPSASASQGTGSARTYVATFKNSDGSAYTGRVGIQLVEATDGGAPVYNDQADFVTFEAVSDSLVAGVPLPNSRVGTAGSDGVVTFTIRHAGTAEDTIPVAWEDLDNDSTYESAGNFAPTEPFGLGGETDFAAGAAAEAVTGSFTVSITKTTKASDVFEGSGVAGGPACPTPATCSFFYDAGDIFSVDGAAASLQEFEDALSIGDVVSSLSPPAPAPSGVYDPDTADQSKFDVTDGTAAITVSDPGSVPPKLVTDSVTVDAATYAIKGTADPGATIRIRTDVDGDGVRDLEDGILITGTADADGNWTVNTPLAQGVSNHFLASQLPAFTGATESASLDVVTIIEGASAGATFESSVATDANTNDILDPGDSLVLNFSENLAGVDGTDTITVTDVEGHTGTITRGTNSTWTVSAGDDGTADLLTIAITGVIPVTGGQINNQATVTAVGGFTDDDGEAINVTSNPAGRTFVI